MGFILVEEKTHERNYALALRYTYWLFFVRNRLFNVSRSIRQLGTCTKHTKVYYTLATGGFENIFSVLCINSDITIKTDSRPHASGAFGLEALRNCVP